MSISFPGSLARPSALEESIGKFATVAALEDRRDWLQTRRELDSYRSALRVLDEIRTAVDGHCVYYKAGPEPDAWIEINYYAAQRRIAALDRARHDFEADRKRFFLCEDGEITFVFVAFDLDDAKDTLRDSNTEFCNPNDYGPGGMHSVPFAAASWLEWRELDREEAHRRIVDTTEDGRGRGAIPLDACDVGEWFGSEW